MMEIEQRHVDAVREAFRLMNWYASRKSLELQGGTDPNAVLGEVYFILAKEWAEVLKQTEQAA